MAFVTGLSKLQVSQEAKIIVFLSTFAGVMFFGKVGHSVFLDPEQFGRRHDFDKSVDEDLKYGDWFNENSIKRFFVAMAEKRGIEGLGIFPNTAIVKAMGDKEGSSH